MTRYRDTSWVIQKFRQYLLGREWNSSQLRKKGNMSSRSPPMPDIPGGPAHKLSDNSYVNRDTRRLTTPPQEIVNVIGQDTIHISHDGKDIEGESGQTLMSAALAAGIKIEAACEGNCACSTCHVYIDENYLDRLEPATEDEEDMLDQAIFVQPNSRLSCQIHLRKYLDGLEFKLPSATRNFYVNNKGESSS